MRYNCAYRLHAIVEKSSEIPTTEPSRRSSGQKAKRSGVKGLCDLFEISTEQAEQHSTHIALLECLSDLTLEARYFASQMASGGYSKALYEEASETLVVAAQTSALRRDWPETQNLLLKTKMPLRYATEMLPSEGDPPSEDEITGLIDLLKEMKGAVSEMSPESPLRRFVGDQISIINRALRSYRIRGPRAFEDASHEMRAAYARHLSQSSEFGNDIKTEAGVAIMQKVGVAWGRLVTWGDQIGKAKHLLKAVDSTRRLLEVFQS